MMYWVIVSLTWLAWHIVFRIKVVGRENLIRDRGFVMVCNHVHALDPVFLIISRFFGKPMVVMGKQELFEINAFVSWFLRTVKVVPVSRGKGDTHLIDEIIEQVKQGRGLFLFPEGTRSKDGNLGKLKSGAFVIASAAQVDMIPCRIIYKGGKLKVFGHVCVVFGKPIPAEKIALQGERNAVRLRECKQLVTQEMERLLQENLNEQ